MQKVKKENIKNIENNGNNTRRHEKQQRYKDYIVSHLNLNKHRNCFCTVRIRCEGVGKNVVFFGDYKGSMQRFWEDGDDVDSDRVG